ncbi:MAG: hypothetical protein HZA92_08225, partial [Verrucomicrobia bacterium]|nr:hypothetical protein [Verrucomicrobiota bacterium]
ITIPLSLARTKAVQAAHIWFAAKPRPGDALKLTYFYNCKFTGPVKGFERHAKFTKLIDLTRPAEAIFASFGDSTQKEIKRLMKEPVIFAVESDAEAFLRFHDEFAQSKGMGAMDAKILRSYWPHVVVTKIVSNQEDLVMHSYVVDPAASRVTQWHSVSQFRGAEDSVKRRLISRANRLLHWRDIEHFKTMGFRVFDIGGYAYNTTDEVLQRINEFKDSFGGEMVEESSYASVAITLLRRVKSAFKLRPEKPGTKAP